MASRARFYLIIIVLLLLAAFSLWAVHAVVHGYDRRIVASPERLETASWEQPRVAVVFGASVFSNGELSPMLEDRMDTAIELYHAKKVDRILVSGDNRHPSYNEPKAMYEYLISHAVDPKHAVVDYAGRSTYETCWRAKEVFDLRRAVLVTQRFHLPRALYLANELGLDAVGVASDIKLKDQVDYQRFREWAAEIKAFFNLHFAPPEVVLGERIPIK
jgi:SanA protein